jgi:hypothetical protein
VPEADALLDALREIHARIRDTVVAACETTAVERMALPVGEDAGDTIFAIDRVSEEALLTEFEALAIRWPMVLIAEGLGNDGRAVLTPGGDPAAAVVRIIVDPIDGTRGLMYQKRPGWILTGVAPNLGEATTLADIVLALQTEIPLIKQHLSDSLWAQALPDGSYVMGSERWDRIHQTTHPLAVHPTGATTIAQGFGNISRFFPGTRGVLATIDDEIVAELLGPPPPNRVHAFEDQYICTGGQLYELMAGHDRWVADLRPLVWARQSTRGLCCHPYDLCSELVARAHGVIVTDALGQALRAPLDVDADIAWIGYANPALRASVEPALTGALARHGLA